MKKIIITMIAFFFFEISFSQTHREILVKPFIDTTSTDFKAIKQLWNDYVDTLFVYSIKSNFKIPETNKSINDFWTQSDVMDYNFPDLIYASNFGMAFYPMEKEFFLGFASRDTNLYEIRTMFQHNNEAVFKNFPDIMMSIYVKKNGDNFKLYNKFSLLCEKNRIVEKKIGEITYYYSSLYHFNISEAQRLQRRIYNFKQGFNIEQQPEIKYLVAENMTEILDWLGINYYNTDFNCTKSTIEGRMQPLTNMIFSGGGGENYMHEIIHMLLKGMRKGNYNLFEEGIACYFGDHQGQTYKYHLTRLKQYLKANEWINLSSSIKGYYKNTETEHSYKVLDEDNPMKDFVYYGDAETSYTYIIHAVLCEMAFKQGGYSKVLDILKYKSDTEIEFYTSIEKYLGIKRKNIDSEIKKMINENY